MHYNIISLMSENKQTLLIIDDDPELTVPLVRLLEFFFKQDEKDVEVLWLKSLSELRFLFSDSRDFQGEFFLALVDSLGQDWEEAVEILNGFAIPAILFSLDDGLVQREARNEKLVGTMDKGLSSTDIYNLVASFLPGN